MKLLRPRVWFAFDIACLKWSCILFGMIVGAFLPEFTRRYVWAFAAAAILLAISPAVRFFRNEPPASAAPRDR